MNAFESIDGRWYFFVIMEKSWDIHEIAGRCKNESRILFEIYYECNFQSSRLNQKESSIYLCRSPKPYAWDQLYLRLMIDNYWVLTEVNEKLCQIRRKYAQTNDLYWLEIADEGVEYFN